MSKTKEDKKIYFLFETKNCTQYNSSKWHHFNSKFSTSFKTALQSEELNNIGFRKKCFPLDIFFTTANFSQRRWQFVHRLKPTDRKGSVAIYVVTSHDLLIMSYSV